MGWDGWREEGRCQSGWVAGMLGWLWNGMDGWMDFRDCWDAGMLGVILK